MKKLILTGSSRCGTTITRDILSAHPKIWLTNELRVFFGKNPSRRTMGPCLYADTAEEYFTALKNKVIKGEGVEYHKFPPGFDCNKMVEICEAHLKEDTLKDRLEAVYTALAGNKDFEWFGDKQASPIETVPHQVPGFEEDCSHPGQIVPLKMLTIGRKSLRTFLPFWRSWTQAYMWLFDLKTTAAFLIKILN